MYIERRNLGVRDMDRISWIAVVFLVILFSLIFFIFWNIQILQHGQYLDLAQQNIYRRIRVKAPRGLIMDRRGRIMADNRLDFSLILIRENSRDLDESIRFAAETIHVPEEWVRNRVERFKGYPPAYPIPIRRNLDLKQVVFIRSRSDIRPEFEISVDPRRDYPLGVVGSHILGHVSEITEEELKTRRDQGYLSGDTVGKTGLENQYEPVLKGTKGTRLVIRDNLGVVRELVEEEAPVAGDSIILTVDLALQQYMEREFQGHTGTVGVVDLSTGGILALVSHPNFSPAEFTGILDPVTWKSLVEDPKRPLQNRFTRGLYSPGSVFKIVMALAGLEEGKITPRTVVDCTGEIRIYNRIFHCWRSWGHGRVDLSEAIRDSCNVYFYLLGRQLDIDTIAEYAGALGLGEPTGIDLPEENPGLVPTRFWKRSQLDQPWYPGETISVAIGGGWVTVTPAQVLTMVSTVALRGRRPSLHLLGRIERRGEILYRTPAKFTTLPFHAEQMEQVIEGMYRVVNDEGTGRASRIPGYDICGKTGTQQVISKENPRYELLVKQKRFRPHAWFASFAPRRDPRYAVVVLVEHGGDAGEIAAPMAARVYRWLFAHE